MNVCKTGGEDFREVSAVFARPTPHRRPGGGASYTDLNNPDFAMLAEVTAVVAFLAHPGRALLYVKVNRVEFGEAGEGRGRAGGRLGALSAKAVLSGRAGDGVDLVTTNILE